MEECSFNSSACEGMITSGNKCLFLADTSQHTSTKRTSWNTAADNCRLHGGIPAVFKTHDDIANMFKFLDHFKLSPTHIYVGIKHSYPSKLPLYSNLFRWLDNTNVYFFNKSFISVSLSYGSARTPDSLSYGSARRCGIFKKYRFSYKLDTVKCGTSIYPSSIMICERTLSSFQNVTENSVQTINMSASLTTWRQQCGHNQSIMVCPQGHTTHTFLACDRQAHCGQDRYVSHCPFFDVSCDDDDFLVGREVTTWSVAMFMCEDDVTTIPYTLVCDFHNHCPDKSDEFFCKHPKCHPNQFHCENGQCIYLEIQVLPLNSECTATEHCKDSSDLYYCYNSLDNNPSESYDILNQVLDPPAVIDVVTIYQTFQFNTMKGLAKNESCPGTHFRCLGKMDYCMPVYMRCNGFNDCLEGEDEQGCQGSTCPGLYRCRGSSVCLHVDHVCDGHVQCPEHDDEWMCQETPVCPQGCLCQGLAFACSRPFNVDLLPQLRYLDIKNTNVNTSQLTLRQRQYLISLTINGGSLYVLPEIELPNIQFLDLRKNNIEIINSSVMFAMPNLRTLRLSDNPLKELLSQDSPANVSSNLQTLDISHTMLGYFDSRLLDFLSSLQLLDISHSSLQRVGAGGFRHFTQLRTLDLRGNRLQHYPANVFSGLKHLEAVFSPDYRLCCREILPAIAVRPQCLADESSLSSCDDLLRSKTHLVALITQSLLAVVGNAFCAFVRHFKYREQSQSVSFSALMTYLNVANFLTGIYATVIAVADFHFHGKFLQLEDTWKSSGVCHAAGFLSVLAQHVSSLLMVLITMDRVLNFQCPSVLWRFNLRSAAVSGVLAWCVGAVLAATPYLTDHSGLYGSSAICVSLPGHFPDQGGSFVFSVHVVFQTVCALLVISGQVFILRSSTASTIDNLDNGSDREELARLFFPLAAVDCLCAAVLSCTGYVFFNNHQVIDEGVGANLAIFVQHINATLNPCLLIGNHIMEDKRKKTHQRLLMILKLRVNMDRREKRTKVTDSGHETPHN